VTSRKRITVALVGLILLVVVGWFVREFVSTDPPARGSDAGSTAAPGAAGPTVLGPLEGVARRLVTAKVSQLYDSGDHDDSFVVIDHRG
jgi:hypothetical protein